MFESTVNPLYLTKVEKKPRSAEEMNAAMCWLTGYTHQQIDDHLEAETTFQDLFAHAALNPKAHLITGSVCGVKVQDIDDPLMQEIRYLDKVVSELAKEVPIDKVLRVYKQNRVNVINQPVPCAAR